MQSEFNNIHLLIVDDESTQRKLLTLMLVDKVANIYQADCAKSAIELFEKHRPNLIISDYMMPDMNGLELIEELKNKDPQIATILISKIEDGKVFEKALDLGINKFLSKPIKKDLLEKYLYKFNNAIDGKKRIRAEQRLLSQYRDIIDSSMLVTKTDTKGNITYANKKFCKISGYKKDELLGKPHNIVRHPDMQKEIFKKMWQTILEKKTWRGTIKNSTKDGGFYIVNATVFPILDNDKNIYEFISIREDITDLYLAKEKERIEREKEHLDKLAKTKESFLVVFTHELKTPLNAIMSFSKYVLKKIKKSDLEGKDELVELLNEVQLNADDMLDNISSILDISKLKSDKLQFNCTNFVLEDLIADLSKQFTVLTSKSGIEVIEKMKSTTPLYHDKNRIKQIISNIFSNAIKYGKDTIIIQVVSDEENFTITIEDNGPGIKDSSNIFELFGQENQGDFKRTSKGTGIGLHFTKMLCDSFGFTIEVSHSKSLGGACFTISGKNHCEGERNV